MTIAPYLAFEGRCEEAIGFYREALGAEVTMLMRFKDAPEQAMTPPGAGEKVMHAALRIRHSMLMASDGRCTGAPSFHGIALSLTAKDPGDAETLFKALSAGGQVTMPLSKTFFSPAFGMVQDKFGVGWMVYVPGT